MIREVTARDIQNAITRLFLTANTRLPGDVLEALQRARAEECSATAQAVLDDILQNASIASAQNVAMCQDTGVAYVFAEVGQDVHITGGSLRDAIDKGVADAYSRGFFRASVVEDPIFNRSNTRNNTPAIVYTDIVPGNEVRLSALPKGTGSENMSALKMLVPADGAAGIRQFVLETVEKAGPNPCPPLIVGVGVGGMMDYAAVMAKKALLRKTGSPHSDPETAELEAEILAAINDLGLGAGGLGGIRTALAVHIETAPTHIGALPVAVNLQCHAARHAQCVI